MRVRARSDVTIFFLNNNNKNKKKIGSSFSAINVLNNKTVILLNLAEYRLILANSAYGLVG